MNLRLGKGRRASPENFLLPMVSKSRMARLAAQSAFNAAQGYARMGRKSPALTHVDFAIAHPRMKEKGEALKAAIEKMP